MYGPLRLIYNNFLTDFTMFTLSSQEDGSISGHSKEGTGVALLTVTGPFTGEFDLTYELEIDSIAGGVEVGESTFKWRTSDSGVGVWEETGILTRSTPAYALSADGLGTGITVAHTGRTGDDFALADSWQWFAKATYGAQRILDFNRMTGWRSENLSENIVMDLGSAQSPSMFILHDHNFTSGATVTLEGNATDSWGAPSFTYTFSSIIDPLYYYFSTPLPSYRYWRLVVADALNSDGYVTFANIFLGTYLQLNKVNAIWGSGAQDGYQLEKNNSQVGVLRRYSYAPQRILSLNFGNTVDNTDLASLLALQAALIDSDTARVNPFWTHQFSDVDETLKLMDWQDIDRFKYQYFSYPINSIPMIQFAEVVKI